MQGRIKVWQGMLFCGLGAFGGYQFKAGQLAR